VPGILRGVGPLRPGEEGLDLGFQPGDLGLHAAVAHGLVLRGVGPDLRAVQGDGAELDQAGPLATAEDLDEERFQGGEVSLPEVADGPEVGNVVRGEDPESHILLTPLGEPAGGGDPGRVAVEEELHHHPGVVRRVAPLLLLVHARDRREVELVDHVGEEEHHVLLGQPVLQGWREQQQLVGLVGAVRLLHPTSLAMGSQAI